MITKEELREKLLDTYAGKPASYNYVHNIVKTVREAFPELEQEKMSFTSDRSKLDMTYDKHFFLSIKIKRTAISKSWRGNEYIYKDFEVNNYYETLEDALRAIDRQIKYENSAEAKNKKQAIEIIKYIKDNFGLTKDQTVEFLNYLKDKKYMILDEGYKNE